MTGGQFQHAKDHKADGKKGDNCGDNTSDQIIAQRVTPLLKTERQGGNISLPPCTIAVLAVQLSES